MVVNGLKFKVEGTEGAMRGWERTRASPRVRAAATLEQCPFQPATRDNAGIVHGVGWAADASKWPKRNLGDVSYMIRRRNAKVACRHKGFAARVRRDFKRRAPPAISHSQALGGRIGPQNPSSAPLLEGGGGASRDARMAN